MFQRNFNFDWHAREERNLRHIQKKQTQTSDLSFLYTQSLILSETAVWAASVFTLSFWNWICDCDWWAEIMHANRLQVGIVSFLRNQRIVVTAGRNLYYWRFSFH